MGPRRAQHMKSGRGCYNSDTGGGNWKVEVVWWTSLNARRQTSALPANLDSNSRTSAGSAPLSCPAQASVRPSAPDVTHWV